MSLTSILNTASTGLSAAQTQLRVVSDNVANVNTPGYVRKIADQVSVSGQGMGQGVDIARIRLATDRFLQAASLNSGAEAARQGARYELYDRIQALFGDPGGDGGFFGRIDALFATFAAAAEDAVSAPRRQDALFRAQALFDEAARIATQIQAVREDADSRIGSAVEKANGLLEQIELLNVEISRAAVAGDDSSGAESAQAKLIDDLAQILDIRVSVRPVGGVSIRTGDGMMLAGDGSATLSYTRAGAVNAESHFSEVWLTEPRGEKRSLIDHLASGEIKGLLELRDREAPAAAERLAELVTRVADELNRAHNANSSAPAPNSLTGRNVGMSLAAALNGFTGRTTIAVTNAAGVIVDRADIVFAGAGVMTINGVGATTANFLAVLNSQLSPAASASFANGVLSLQAAAGNGVAIQDDATTPSNKAGRGFSHFFGLNDLVRTDRNALYETGLTGTSPHGFGAGQTLTFRFQNDKGARLRDIQVEVPPGASMNQLLTALNSTSTGIGRFGSFALDSQGRLNFTPATTPAATLSVIEDTTTQVPSGVSLSELFGIGAGVRASRADGFSIRADILQSPSLLALAEIDLTVAAGVPALATGDGRGALRLADAGQRPAAFAAAGGAAGGSVSVSRYASELSGDIGGKAAAAHDRHEAAKVLHTEAKARQSGYEGVNLDEELVKLTTYQQAFNASARMIQAAKDMYDVLIGMI